MLPFGLLIPRSGPRIAPFRPRISASSPLVRLCRQSLQKSLRPRCYSQRLTPSPVKRPSRLEEELRREARAAAAKNSKQQQHELPERLIIYHAGTGRTTFLAMVKITTLFLGAFFCFIVTPSYIKAGKPEWETAGVALCGVIPLLFVAYTTSPFVTHIHVHLPDYARASRAILDRFVRELPPSTDLTLTTMSAIAKPRYSSVKAGDLMPAHRRFGIINYVRDTRQENARRRWYNFRAVANFYVQDRPVRRVRYEKKATKGVVDTWIWDAIKQKIATRAQTRSL